MLPLIKKLWFALWFDEVAAKRWLAGVLVWLATTGGQVLAYPFDDVATWTFREWLYRIVVSGVAATGVMVATGQKNHTVEQIQAIAAATPTPPPGP